MTKNCEELEAELLEYKKQEAHRKMESLAGAFRQTEDEIHRNRKALTRLLSEKKLDGNAIMWQIDWLIQLHMSVKSRRQDLVTFNDENAELLA